MDRDSQESQATHRAKFRKRCRDEVLSVAELSRFVELSKQAIPSVLSRLEVQATCSDRRRFAALMSSRLAILETQARYYRYHNWPRNASRARSLIQAQINP